MGRKKGKEGAFQARGTSPLRNCIINERSVVLSSKQLATSILDASKILTELPNGMKELKDAGRVDKIPDLIALNRSTARDLDGFVAEKTKLDATLESHIASRPKDQALLADHNSRTLSIGNDYVELGQKMIGTVGKSTEQIIEILTPDADVSDEPAQVEEAVV